MESQNFKYIKGHKHISYSIEPCSEEEVMKRSESFYKFQDRRRSIREYSDKSVPGEVIENLIKTASTAPSGANKQPWTFCAISNSELKSQIRQSAEEEEIKNYESRMSKTWKKDLDPLATAAKKPFLENAPWLIVVFKRGFEYEENGSKHPNYYVNESVGIACGILISAIHNAGLSTLTYTPGPMNFLLKLLRRPDNERPYLILPVGYPKSPTYVPDIQRKELTEMSIFYE